MNAFIDTLMVISFAAVLVTITFFIVVFCALLVVASVSVMIEAWRGRHDG